MFEDTKDELEIEETEEPEEKEADVEAYEITSYPSDMTLDEYVNKWNKEQLVIPQFQRNYVWDQIKASKLIESFLLGLPVPNIFLNRNKETGKLFIVDGLQRIYSIVKFFKGDKDFNKLKNVLPKWDGKTYETLNEEDKYKLSDSILRAIIIQPLDPDDNISIFKIFERLHIESVALNPMEIRKCVYSGEFMSLLEELNTLEEWRSLLGQDKLDLRLRDLELVLRCLALKENWQNYKKPMKAFLNDYMANAKKFDAESMLKIEKLFKETCKKLCSLNKNSFYLNGRLNYAVLDSVFYGVSQNIEKSNLESCYDILICNTEYQNCVKQNTSDAAILKKRFQLAVEAFSNG
jgi:hypothetical protein